LIRGGRIAAHGQATGRLALYSFSLLFSKLGLIGRERPFAAVQR
jgi:hypothetical protein